MYLNLTGNPNNELLNEDKGSVIYYFNDNNEPLTHFGRIQNVNIFVGANNSGKSRFLRGLLKHEAYVGVDDVLFEKRIKILKEGINKLKNKLNNSPNISLAFDPINISNNLTYFTESFAELVKIYRTKGGHGEQSIDLNSTYLITLISELIDYKNRIIDKKTHTEFKECVRKNILQLKTLIDVALSNGMLNYAKNRGHYTASNVQLIQPHVTIFEELINELNRLETDALFTFYDEVQRIYIPVLRTASSIYDQPSGENSIQKTTRDIFKYSVGRNYNIISGKPKINIRTGMDLYQSIRLTRNSVRSVRKNFEAFEAFISKNFFNGDGFDIVAKEEIQQNKNEEHIIVHLGRETIDRNIHDLGDGIQALIIMMYPIFTAENGAWVFIEEPEINLHPGLQRVFLEQITTNPDITKKELKFFITTHSNHLLDLVLEPERNRISIFTFQQEKLENKNIKRIRNVLSGDTDILKSLGVNNSSVFTSNCSIWVEGHTDRIYLKAYLKAFLDHFPAKKIYKEDLHYSFFEYAGSNLSHYLFIDKNEIDPDFLPENVEHIQAQFLANRIFLLADRDKGKEKKHSFFNIQESKNFIYRVLKSKEIENLVSPTILQAIVSKLTKNNASAQKLKSINDVDLYKNDFLGAFLDKKFKEDLPSAFLSSDKKTISAYYKKLIADFVSKDLKWSDMTVEAQKLTKEIYNFIESHNQ